jgi:hypothetical protein
MCWGTYVEIRTPGLWHGWSYGRIGSVDPHGQARGTNYQNSSFA